jgi:predicted XRE-type DNA-binding protein
MAKSTAPITSEDITVTHGSGNVFADLGFDDAEELQVKAGLTHHIASRIKALGLTQAQAGDRLGISQPDVSKLMRGRYTGFSTDRLLALLTTLDLDIDIVLRPCHDHAESHRVRVRMMRPRRPRHIVLECSGALA